MISREELRKLAAFESHRPNELAISFYFPPGTPQDRSHREEAILAKDVVRHTIEELQAKGPNRAAMNDLEKILRLAERLHGNQSRTKAVFACGGRNIWQEFDVPCSSPSTRLVVNRRFHLKPLAPVFSEYPRLWIGLVDRQHARILELQFDELREQAVVGNSLPRHGRSDRIGGYDAGHAQRHEEDEFRRHYRAVAEFLKSGAERKQFEALVVGCHDVNWPEFQAQLHPYVRKRLLGRFSSDLGALTDSEAKREAERLLRESLKRHHENLIEEAVKGAESNGLGVTGLRRVLRATEMGEVETLLMTPDYTARAVECTACGHLDSHLVPFCVLCGRATRKLEDVSDALVLMAIRHNIGLVLVPRDRNFERVGNIAAVLRFRADRNMNQLQAS